jgi:DNA-binding NarL/FixJ family response regulator
MLTIGLIDNIPITRLGLSILLKDYFKDIKFLEANTIQEFGIVYKQQKPDVIVLGNNYKSNDKCLDAAKLLKSQNPDIPLVVYDEQLMDNLTISYFRIGIDGYLLRQNTDKEIVNCIQTVLNHKRYLCPVLTEQFLNSLSETHLENPGTKKNILTPRETEIANYLGQGMKIIHISNMLGRKPSTISSIKHNIFKKLKVQNLIELREAFTITLPRS